MIQTEITLNWGIIGAGIIAHTMADAISIASGNRLFAVASKTPDKARAFAEKHNIAHVFSYQEIVESSEVDIIYVATTHNFHFENAKLALEHGKHVMIEKPFTVNAREAHELVRIAREKKLFLMEAIWTRFLPVVKLLKQKIASHEIGEVKQMTISFGGFVPPKYEKRLTDPKLAGGVTLDMGIYPISFACYMLGEIPVEVKSMTRFSNLGVDELATYMFRFPSGCMASITTSFNLKMTNEALIYGSRGYIRFPDFPAGQKFKCFVHNGTNEIESEADFDENRPNHGFEYQVEEAAQCIKTGKTESEIIPLSETIAIMELMDKMRDEWGLVYPFETS